MLRANTSQYDYTKSKKLHLLSDSHLPSIGGSPDSVSMVARTSEHATAHLASRTSFRFITGVQNYVLYIQMPDTSFLFSTVCP